MTSKQILDEIEKEIDIVIKETKDFNVKMYFIALKKSIKDKKRIKKN